MKLYFIKFFMLIMEYVRYKSKINVEQWKFVKKG